MYTEQAIRLSGGEAARNWLLEFSILPRVINPITVEAFRKVDRLDFVPLGKESLAYRDMIINLSSGSSLSEPGLIAEMIDNLGLSGSENVLEIGGGRGYTTALLSTCCKRVVSMEYEDTLADFAKEKLTSLGFNNVDIHTGDGALGFPQKAPYDGIIVWCGARNIPRHLFTQLAEGGRLVIPVGGNLEDLDLIVGIKQGDHLMARIMHKVRFKPLVSKEHGGWPNRITLDSEEERRRTFKIIRRLILSSDDPAQTLAEIIGVERDAANELLSKADL